MATQVLDHPLAPAADSPARRWAGRVLFVVSVVFLLFDAVSKLMLLPAVVKAMPALGYPVSVARPIGAVLLVAVVLYVWPRTAVLGAILITGFLGGAVATHVRIGNPLAGYVLFPVYVGIMVWGALWLRDARVRALLPARG